MTTEAEAKTMETGGTEKSRHTHPHGEEAVHSHTHDPEEIRAIIQSGTEKPVRIS